MPGDFPSGIEGEWDNNLVILPPYIAYSNPTVAPSSSSGGSFASGVSSLFGALGGLVGSVAQGVGQGIANNVVTRATNSGRQPGAETLANPLSQPTTAAAPSSSLIPGVSNLALGLGIAGVIGLGLVAVIAARR